MTETDNNTEAKAPSEWSAATTAVMTFGWERLRAALAVTAIAAEGGGMLTSSETISFHVDPEAGEIVISGTDRYIVSHVRVHGETELPEDSEVKVDKFTLTLAQVKSLLTLHRSKKDSMAISIEPGKVTFSPEPNPAGQSLTFLTSGTRPLSDWARGTLASVDQLPLILARESMSQSFGLSDKVNRIAKAIAVGRGGVVVTAINRAAKPNSAVELVQYNFSSFTVLEPKDMLVVATAMASREGNLEGMTMDWAKWLPAKTENN